MDINKLKSVLILTQIGSISKASEYMFISQPTFSRYVQDVEEELNIKLFARSKKGVVLTEQGKKVLPYIRDIVSDYDEFNKDIRDLRKKDEKKHMSIGYCTAHSKILTEYASRVHSKFSDIEIDYHELNFSEMPPMIHDHRMDLCLLQGNDHPFMEDYGSRFLAKSQICLIMSKNNPLVNRKTIRPSDLLNETFVALNRTKGGVILDRRRYTMNGFVPYFKRYYDTIQDMLFHVATTNDLAFFCSVFDGSLYNIVCRKITGDLDQFQQDLYFIWDKSNEKVPLIEQYLSLI